MFRPSPNPMNNATGDDLRHLLKVLTSFHIPVEKVTVVALLPGPLLEDREVLAEDLDKTDPQEYSIHVAGLPLNAAYLVRTLKSHLTPHDKAWKLFGQAYPTAGGMDWFSHALSLPAIRNAYEKELKSLLS